MPAIRKVLTTVSYSGLHWDRLVDALGDAQVIRVSPQDGQAVAAALETVDVAILGSDIDERYLDAPNLAWVHCDHAGLNASARPEVFARGLRVTSSAGRSSPALAEHALFFMLALAYNIPAFLGAQKAHVWGVPGMEKLRGLFGRTVGILGLGNNGRELALRCAACGMRVLGYDRCVDPVPEGVDVMYGAGDPGALESILRESDFVVLCLTLNDDTWHLIGERELALMGPGSFLVNIARGPLVDEKALLAALRSGAIAGAGLDTFDQEPLPPENPLWDAPNVILTPHVTPQVPDRTGRSLDIICDNIRRWRTGEPLRNLLGREDMYSKR